MLRRVTGDMKNIKYKHSDCRNFIAIDVAKGICNIFDKDIFIDGDICPDFLLLPKCKNCENFLVQDEKEVASCKGFSDNYWTFDELSAVNCEKYKLKK